MLHHSAVVIAVLELCLMLHVSSALRCYERSSVSPPLPRDVYVNQPQQETLCPTNEPHTCLKGELISMQTEGENAGTESRIEIGACVAASVCNLRCEVVFTTIFRRLQLPTAEDQDTMSQCTVSCCDTDNCNANIEEENDLKERESRSVPFWFHSLEFPGSYIGIRDTLAYIMDSDGESFRLVSPGLAGTPGSVSFLSTTQDNHYLRHQDGIIKLHPRIDQQLYIDDATFLPRYNLYYQGYAAYESVNFRRHFIRRLANNQLWINPFQNTDEYKRSVSFKSVKSTISTSSALKIYALDRPDRCFGSTAGNSRIILVDCNAPNGDSYIVVSPGLRGTPGSVSFQSESDSDYYLRLHGGNEGFLILDRMEDSLQYKNAATFMPRKSGIYPGYTAFESVLHPNSHIRSDRNRPVSFLHVDTEQDASLVRSMVFALLPN